MRVPTESTALQFVEQRLAEFLDTPLADVTSRDGHTSHGVDSRVDRVADVGPFTFVIEWKSSGSTASVSAAVEGLRHTSESVAPEAIPLVVVPFMGKVGQRICREADVSWLDLSGNARIFAPGLRLHIEGQPNKYKRPGRPSSVFAPKSSRIARWLLINSDRSMTQREVARATNMDEGFTSRIVARLVEDGLVARERGGAIRPRDPDLLLDAWREEYSFDKHDVTRGHVAARSGDALVHHVAEAFRDGGVGYAATALPAAWLMTRFVGFRLMTVYLKEHPSPRELDLLSFREGARGANVWLVVPSDEGVFHGAEEHEGVRCVHPVQVYLDLKRHPERSGEAAERLREELLSWRNDG